MTRLLMAALMLLSAAADAEIFKCETMDGNLLFTDSGCRPGDVVESSPQHAEPTERVPPVKGLSAAEHKALADLQQRLDAARREHSQRRAKAARQALAGRELAASRCAEATWKLKRIGDMKSRGYRLSEAQRIDNELSRLNRERKDNC